MGQRSRIQEFTLPRSSVSVMILWYSQTSESNPFITVDIKGTDPSVDITKVSVLERYGCRVFIRHRRSENTLFTTQNSLASIR